MKNISSNRLLIVDDDIGTIRALAAALKDLGEVHFSTSGADALALVREWSPTLILLDESMPGLDGFAVCTAIKSDPAHADLPILFITAHSDAETEAQALALGAVDFISKPFNPTIVQARVRTHLGLKRRTDELQRMASLDGLTAIANRRVFDDTLDMEWRRACRSLVPLSLLIVDVDHFKRFNDHYGHQAGDACLRTIAATLAANVRRPGELVARYGGEEFTVILPACGQAVALKLAEKLRASVAALAIPHAASDVSDRVTVSIGVASLAFPEAEAGGADPEETRTRPSARAIRETAPALVAAADQGLYGAKRAGRNRVAATPAIAADRLPPAPLAAEGERQPELCQAVL